jgi:hypothetical protein
MAMGDTFLSAMQAKWAEYGNVYSPRLQITWLQIQATLDYQSGPDALDVWPVIPAELGIGKTTAAKLWCSRMPDEKSALVVVRTREQAQEFAADVNAWSGEKRAVALFAPDEEQELPNEYWAEPWRTKTFQVVVVCHKSYELGLDEFSLVAAQQRFDIVHQYLDRARDITIVDEAIDQVAEARIGRGAMTVLAHLLRRVQYKHLGAMRVIDSVERAAREAPLDRARALAASELLALTDYNVEQATAHLDALWQSVRFERRIQPEPRAIIGETLTVLRRHLATAPWTDKANVSSARLLRMPESTKGVVLDATGQLNNVYRARPAEFDVRVIAPVRSYTGVTIFEAMTNDTGKTRVKKAATRIAEKTVRALVEHYGDQIHERRLLVVTAADDDTKAAFREQLVGAGFAEYDITNWGKVDGRNTWKHYDTLLIVSLHYGSSTQDINTWLAVKGLEPDDETLNAVDEIRAIKERRIAATITQAIGRLRLRTMTREDGGCLPCDVFVRLPNFKGVVDAGKIMTGVEQTLPGVARVPWARASTKLKRDGRPAKTKKDVAARLLALADQVAADSQPRELTIDSLKTSNGTLHRVLDQAKGDGPLAQELAAKGVRVVPGDARTPARLVLATSSVPVTLTANEAAVVAALRALPLGSTTKASAVRAAAGVPPGSWGGLIAREGVVQAMAELGIAYQGSGSGQVAVFVRG